MAHSDRPTRLTGRLAGVHPVGGGLTIPQGADTARSRFGNVTMPRDVMTLGGREEWANSGHSTTVSRMGSVDPKAITLKDAPGAPDIALALVLDSYPSDHRHNDSEIVEPRC